LKKAGVGTEKLLGVKLEMAGDRKVVLDSKLALERIQLDYHHAILVEEATSAELQRLLEAECGVAEMVQRLMQVRARLRSVRCLLALRRKLIEHWSVGVGVRAA